MTQPEYNSLIQRATDATDLMNEIDALNEALLYLGSSVFSFYLGKIPFSEVKPGFGLPMETWATIRKEITSAIENRIKELKQQFDEL